MIISSLVAMNSNRLIGLIMIYHGSSKDDLEHFKNYSMNKPIIMGKNTYESIGRPLPNRTNIIVSNTLKQVEGYHICSTLEEAIQLGMKYSTNDEIILIGGSKILKKACKKLINCYFWVDANHLEGDIYFPEFERKNGQK